MGALVAVKEQIPVGAFIPVNPVFTAEDMRKRAKEARKRIEQAGADYAQAKWKRKREAELEAARIAWEQCGQRIYDLPIGPPTIGEHLAKTTTKAKILREVAEKHEVAVKELLGSKRWRRLMPAKREAMYRMRVELPKHLNSLPQIGTFFGRDHTTVLHNIRAHCDETGDPRPEGMEPWEPFSYKVKVRNNDAKRKAEKLRQAAD